MSLLRLPEEAYSLETTTKVKQNKIRQAIFMQSFVEMANITLYNGCKGNKRAKSGGSFADLLYIYIFNQRKGLGYIFSSD